MEPKILRQNAINWIIDIFKLIDVKNSVSEEYYILEYEKLKVEVMRKFEVSEGTAEQYIKDAKTIVKNE